MKVLSVQQPFATLLVLGLKPDETRSWATKHRGETGIHASKKIDKESCRREPIKSALAAHGFDETNLPTGCIVGIGNIMDCYKVIEDTGYSAVLENGEVIEGENYHFGYFEKDRFAWRMADMQQIKPIPAKGQLGLWNYQEGDPHG
jgi:hypothetical protein